jgi:hypothetical protein
MLFKSSAALKYCIGATVLLSVASLVAIQFNEPRRLAIAVLSSDSVSLAMSRVQQFLIPANNAACLNELSGLDVEYRTQSDFEEGGLCIVKHSVRLSHANGMDIANAPLLTCRMAYELSSFAEGTLQPTAIQTFGSPIKTMSHIGTYNCRSMRQYPGVTSQHGFANAIDVTGFTLVDGTDINIARDWNGKSAKGEFLRIVAEGGCNGFRVSVSPDSGANHWNHFHWDMGPYWSCK